MFMSLDKISLLINVKKKKKNLNHHKSYNNKNSDAGIKGESQEKSHEAPGVASDSHGYGSSCSF